MEVSIHSYKLSMEETARYAKLADEAVSRSDVLVLNGYNAGLRVINKALQVKQGKLLGIERRACYLLQGDGAIQYYCYTDEIWTYFDGVIALVQGTGHLHSSSRWDW